MSLHLHEEAAHAATEIGSNDDVVIARGIFLWPLVVLAMIGLGALVAVLW